MISWTILNNEHGEEQDGSQACVVTVLNMYKVKLLVYPKILIGISTISPCLGF